jgi:peptidoglycan/LPS O-acetylase OafA/YrhL
MAPLTALRFPAAFWVMLFHYVTVLPEGGIRSWAPVGKGYLAVDFFFILSGFILSHAHGEELLLKRLSFRDFCIKRLARIYPLHVLTLALYVAGILVVMNADQFGAYAQYLQKYKDYLTTYSVIDNLLLTHGWGFESDLTFNKPSWSISSEWFAYLLFPFLIPVVAGIKSRHLLSGAVLFLIGVWVLTPFIVFHPMTELTFNFSVLRIVPEFILGMALYAFGRQYALTLPAKNLFYVCCALIMALSFFAVSPIYFICLLGAVVYSAAEMCAQGYDGFFSRRIPVYLGTISYAVYMVHFLVMDALYVFWVVLIYGNQVTLDMFLLIWLCMFALTFALSPLLYQFVENPCRFWICRRFLDKKH